MKKLIFLFSFALTLNVCADTVGLLHLIGIVPAMLSIEVVANNDSSNLDLSASPIDLEVANVVEDSNSETGYQILAQAQNGGVLMHSQGLDQLSYTAKYAGTVMSLDGGPVKVKSSGGVFHEESPVTISYEGRDATNMVSGNYSDTITFTIVAN